MWFKTTLGGYPIEAIADSGAAAIVVGGTWYKRADKKQLRIKKVGNKSLVGANEKAPLEVIGRAEGNLKFGNQMIKISMLVAPELPVDLLLSWTFLKKYKMEIIEKQGKYFLRLALIGKR